jgi:hypothetical protein
MIEPVSVVRFRLGPPASGDVPRLCTDSLRKRPNSAPFPASSLHSETRSRGPQEPLWGPVSASEFAGTVWHLRRLLRSEQVLLALRRRTSDSKRWRRGLEDGDWCVRPRPVIELRACCRTAFQITGRGFRQDYKCAELALSPEAGREPRFCKSS